MSGAICLSSSSHFPPTVFERHKASSVAARLRQAVDVAGANRVRDVGEHDRHGAGYL